MSNAFNLSQLANNVNSSGLLSASAGVTGTLPIANGGTNSTATPTNGGVAYGTGTANAYTVAGTSGYVLTSAGAAAPTWVALASSGNPAGTIIQFAGTTAPTGYLLCPTSATTISRTTYADLFTAIGTTWGAGNGSTTFGLPWFAANYAAIQANANVGTASIGQVIAHTHIIGDTSLVSTGSVDAPPLFHNIEGSLSTSSTGGAANLAAGARVLFCIKF